MAVFKCKMCGGALEINGNETVAVCEYCGTKQTLPKLTDDRKANLYDRANHFRRNNEFDKAMSIYESILNEDKTDAESYWSLVLCRYGVEYVEDPASKKRIPTVNRAQYTSIFMDEDYKSAIEYADGFQKDIYEAEAKAIDEIQKGILEISQKEEPFDVFICYKETDANGRRTPDSVLATELYHELCKEGFKVFFSRITLEDKLGTAYEPYIFAALNSAKVMVVLGTKQEYFNAVWVKNEWSRYLALIKNGARKTLIPAYKDMDPYDLPEEFSHLQAQDMTKLGFMQDLVRGIRKIAGEEEKPAVIKETVMTSASANTNTAPLLERAFMFLEDGDWQSADEYCEKVLDVEPKNAQAYLGKLMAEFKVRKQVDFKNCVDPFDGSGNFQKVIKFADEKLKSEINGYVDEIKQKLTNKKLSKKYYIAIKEMDTAKTADEFYDLSNRFKKLVDFKDSEKLYKDCLLKADTIKKSAVYFKAKAIITGAATETEIDEAINLLQEQPDYLDSAEIVATIKQKWLKKVERFNILISNYKALFIKDLQKKITDVEEEIEKRNIRINSLQSERNALNIFALKRKNEINGAIVALQAEIENLNNIAVKLKTQLIEYTSISVIDNKVNSSNLKATRSEQELLLKEGSYSFATIEDVIAELTTEEYRPFAKKDPLLKKLFLDAAQPGDSVFFGAYEQDNNMSNGKEDIEWIVLAREDNRILVVSKYALDAQQYDNVLDRPVTWETCTLRKWLNNEFFNTAFTTEEQKQVLLTAVQPHPNSKYSTDSGNVTQDKIFLLSTKEVEMYFPSEGTRMCVASKYAISKGVMQLERYCTSSGEPSCFWWLRTPGYRQSFAIYVVADSLTYNGNYGSADGVGVRPALWLVR